MNLTTIRDFLQQEDRCLHEITRLREVVEQDFGNFMDAVYCNNREHALERAIETVQYILESAVGLGINFYDIAPGHGPGHLIRDFVNAYRLLKNCDFQPEEIYVGFVGGVLHDFGLALVDRYQESSRVIRHAEAAAILQAYIEDPVASKNSGQEDLIKLQSHESLLFMYAMAAHTHYLKPMKAGEGEIQPYADMIQGDRLVTGEEGEPFLPAWITRWVDRLDCGGPCFLGRHYLTLAEEHEDYSSDRGFYDVKYANHMRPFLRSNEEIAKAGDGRTMLEHYNMFAQSQTNESPYGRYDTGPMVGLRDSLRAVSLDIIAAIVGAKHTRVSEEYETLVRESWINYLGTNIEPTSWGVKAAQILDKMFGELPEETRHVWVQGFYSCMRAYRIWAQAALKELDDLRPEQLHLPGLTPDVREVIEPASSWEGHLPRG